MNRKHGASVSPSNAERNTPLPQDGSTTDMGLRDVQFLKPSAWVTILRAKGYGVEYCPKTFLSASDLDASTSFCLAKRMSSAVLAFPLFMVSCRTKTTSLTILKNLDVQWPVLYDAHILITIHRVVQHGDAGDTGRGHTAGDQYVSRRRS